MNDFEKIEQLFSDESVLKDNLSFIAIFVCIYEKYTDIIVERVKDMYTVPEIKNGKYIENTSDSYKIEIKNRVVDKKGNPNVLLSSVLHFVDLGVITHDEYDLFLYIRDKRNTYTHEMTNVLLEGFSENDILALLDMLELFKKMDDWWLQEYEAPILGIEPQKVKDGYSFAFGLYTAMICKLFNYEK